MPKIEEILSFYSGYYPNMDIYKFACDAAYRDMCRTLDFTDKTNGNAAHDKTILDERQKMKNTFRNVVANNIRNLKSVPYDKWHKRICDELMCLYNNHSSNVSKGGFLNKKMTCGQAQKWLNMMMKHLWLLLQCHSYMGNNFPLKRGPQLPNSYQNACKEEYSDSFEEEKRIIIQQADLLHIPLDSYILRYIAQEPKAPKKNNARPQNTDIKRMDSYFDGKNNMYEWSKINNYNDYYHYQVDVRNDLITNHGIIPIEWELKHWHKAIDFYND